MEDKEIDDRLTPLNKVFVWVMVSGFLAAVILYAVAYVPFLPHPARDALRQIGLIVVGVVIVSLIQVKALGDFYQWRARTAISPDLKNIEARLLDEFRRALPEVKAETVRSIDEIRARVSDAAGFMLTGIDILSGAKAAGISNIFPMRYEKIAGKSVIDVIREDIQAESSEVRLMGISLGDYFLDRGVLHTAFLALLNVADQAPTKKPSLRALLVHPKCETLRERARWEVGPEYYRIPAFFDSTTFIETDGAAGIAKRLREKCPTCLEVRLYSQAPTAFVLLTSRFAFIEAYNYAARGSNVPVFQVQAGAALFRHYECHFERIWSVSEPVDRYDPFALASGMDRMTAPQ